MTARLVMMGTGTFAVPTLDALLAGPHAVVGLVTQPDRAGVTVRGTTRQVGRGMKAIAEAAGVPVFQPESINTAEGVEQLRQWSPDVVVVAAYGQILSDAVIGVPRLGMINVHASLLPKYRGAAPIAWAIDKGESETGVCIIRVVPRLDAGEIFARHVEPIGPADTTGELEARLAPIGGRLATEVVERMLAGTAVGEPQDMALVTRAPKFTKEHGRLDWTQRAEVIERRVRAAQPWPTAYAFLHKAGKPPLRVIFGLTRVLTEPPPARLGAGPGCVAQDGDRLLARCGEGTVLEVLELQPAGKRRMGAAEFLRGRVVQAGERFAADELPEESA